VLRAQPYLRRDIVPYLPHLAGRQGWLALLGVATTFAPLSRVYTLATSLDVLSPSTWGMMTAPENAAAHPLWPLGAVVEQMANVLMLATSTLAAYAYWRRRRSFPLLFLMSQGIAIVTLILTLMVSPPAQWPSGVGLARDGIVTLAWCAYVSYSMRVKATFLSEEDARPPPSPAAAVPPEAVPEAGGAGGG
jgi:hypothetical protein